MHAHLRLPLLQCRGPAQPGLGQQCGLWNPRSRGLYACAGGRPGERLLLHRAQFAGGVGRSARPAIAGPRHLPISALVSRVSGEARDPGGRGDTAFTRGGPQVRRGGVPVLRSGAAAPAAQGPAKRPAAYSLSGLQGGRGGLWPGGFSHVCAASGGPGPAAAGAGP